MAKLRDTDRKVEALIVLDELEVEFLKEFIQNPISDDEHNDVREFRKELWDVLTKAEEVMRMKW